MKFKNLGFLSVSNILSLIVSLLLVMVLPKFIGIEVFSHWQLYLYWLAFSSVFHFGWVDGVYIYCGRSSSGVTNGTWDKINFYKFLYVSFCVFFISILIIFLTLTDDFLLLSLLAISVLLTNIRAYFYSIMQSQGYLKEYASNVILSNVLQITLICIAVTAFSGEILFLVIADLFSRLLTTFSSALKVSLTFENKNIGVPLKKLLMTGSPIVLAYLVVIINTALVRGVFNLQWGLAAFGGLSLMMSVSKVFLLGFQPLTLTMFPVLKKLTADIEDGFIGSLDYLLSYILILIMCSYYIFGLILVKWLPAYSDYITFYYILGGFCFFETRFFSIYVPAAKAKEKTLLLMRTNLATLLLISLSCLFFGYIYPNQHLLVGMVVVSSAFKLYLVKYQILPSDTLMLKILIPYFLLTFASTLMIFDFWVEMFITYTFLFSLYTYFCRNKIYMAYKTIRGA
jgi:O-antigen/teichoic acid export membrane protein